MSKLKKISADEMPEQRPNSNIIGTFEGMCADADITNENGLDITREVWETVFASDIYKQAIELGWYIGYAGHPEDPNYMNFNDACIIMKEGHIDDDGKVYGKFDLIDTPVGRVIKSCIDAGVTFGISVRGAGDIIDNSVDPETFVFRGFDLVTFPAYKEAIPTFTEIAASSDVDKQRKYKAVCAAVKKNLKDISSAEAVELIQEQFAPQSEEYALLEERKNELVPESTLDEDLDITSEQLEGVMQLYLEEKQKNDTLEDEIFTASTKLKKVKASYERKLKSIERITAAQNRDFEDELFRSVSKYNAVKAASNKLKQENIRLQRVEASVHELRSDVARLTRRNDSLQSKNAELIQANSRLKSDNAILSKDNLKYKQKIEATANAANDKDAIISDLRTELTETVNATTDMKNKTSNLDATVRNLRQDLDTATKLVEEYQNAYATLYASAIGVRPESVKVTSTTSVKELQSVIGSSTLNSQTSDITPTYSDILSEDEDGLVTI